MDRFSTDFLSAAPSGDSSDSQRSGSRDSVLLVAQFRVAGGDAVPVRVRNLSAGGLMAEYAQPLARGAVVEVEVRGAGWIPGHVAWCAEGRVGVAFDREIDPHLVRKAMAEGAQAILRNRTDPE